MNNATCKKLKCSFPCARLCSTFLNVVFVSMTTRRNPRMYASSSWNLPCAKVPALSVCNSSVLALFASGRTRGLTLEVGGGIAHAVPVFEGFALNHAILRLEGAGQDITHQLKVMLAERGNQLRVSFARKNTRGNGFRFVENTQMLSKPMGCQTNRELDFPAHVPDIVRRPGSN